MDSLDATKIVPIWIAFAPSINAAAIPLPSASIPVLLDELKKAGKLQPGMKIVVAGFGAGLTWGGMYLEW